MGGNEQSRGRGGNSGKIGRNRVKCERYRVRGRRESNKVRKLLKHCRAQPRDEMAAGALVALQIRR